MKNVFMRLWKEEDGQDLIEYALLIVLMSLAAIGSIGGLATAVNGVFGKAAGRRPAFRAASSRSAQLTRCNRETLECGGNKR